MTGKYKTKSGRIVDVKCGIDTTNGKDVSHLIEDGTLMPAINDVPQIQNENADDYFTRGKFYLNNKYPEVAVKDFEKAIGLRGSAKDYAWCGLAYSNLPLFGMMIGIELVDKTIEYLTKAIDLSEKPIPEYYNARGNAYFTRRDCKYENVDLKNAYADYNKALEIDPNYENAKKNKLALEKDYPSLISKRHAGSAKTGSKTLSALTKEQRAEIIEMINDTYVTVYDKNGDELEVHISAPCD